VSRPRPRLVGALLLLAVGVPTVVPVVFVLAHGFSDSALGAPVRPSLAPWDRAFGTDQTVRSILTSAVLAIRVPVGVALAAMLAWALVRLDVPGRSVILGALWFSFFLPILPMAMGWNLLADKDNGLLNNWLAKLPFVDGPVLSTSSIPGILWVHLTLSTVPIMTMLISPAISRLDPALEEASDIAGAALWTTLRRITVPLLLPAILTAFVAGLIKSFEVFEVEQYLGVPTGILVYSTRIYTLVETIPPDYPQAMALSALFLVILLAVAIWYQVVLVRHSRRATLGGRGSVLRRRPRTWRSYALSAALFATLAVTLLMPLGILVAGSFTKLFGFFTLAHPWTTAHWTNALSNPAFRAAAQNSFVVGLSVAAAGTALYAGLAWVLARRDPWGGRIIATMAWLPWAIPGVLVGIAFLSLTLRYSPVLMTTLVPMVAVLIVQGLPLGVSMTRSSFDQLSAEMEEQSAVAGAGTFTTFRRITVRLVTPMLVSVFILTFMAALKDISTTVLLGRPGTMTLPLLMFQYSTSGQTETAAVVGVLTALGALLATATVARLGMRLSIEG
jgi:iron(III) transport system permease protein